MSLVERFEAAALSSIANWFLAAIAGLGGWIALNAVDYVLPPQFAEALGSPLAAEVCVALALIVLLLSGWVLHLRLQSEPEAVEVRVEVPVLSLPEEPKRSFTEFGFWHDLSDGLNYCAKCDITPLHRQEVGWYCVKCHHLYDDPEFQRKQKEELEARLRHEDAVVRRINSGRDSWMS